MRRGDEPSEEIQLRHLDNSRAPSNLSQNYMNEGGNNSASGNRSNSRQNFSKKKGSKRENGGNGKTPGGANINDLNDIDERE